MTVAYLTLCLNNHITYIIGIRVKLRWRFIVPSGVPKFFTCRSVGSGTQEDLGSFCICKRAAWVWRDRWMHYPTLQLRGRRQVVIALSALRNPPRLFRMSESKLSHEVAGRPILNGLLTCFTLSPKINYVICMIINESLYDYTRPLPAQLRIILLSFLFYFILWGMPSVCPLSWNYYSYPCYKHWCTCKHYYSSSSPY
jgi:hypothetical protein